jgi:hypothetical protein
MAPGAIPSPREGQVRRTPLEEGLSPSDRQAPCHAEPVEAHKRCSSSPCFVSRECETNETSETNFSINHLANNDLQKTSETK